MILDKVTVTGADDSISPDELFPLAKKYPFLEFGILLSKRQVGGHRFPSVEWQRELARIMYSGLRLSGHLCGEYVRQAYRGDFIPVADASPLCTYFNRVQLNTHGIPHEVDILKLAEVIKFATYEERQIIFQFDQANTETLTALTAQIEHPFSKPYPISALFDLSHGGGLLPQRWSRPFAGYCGYAGGLSADNVEDQLKRIAPHHGDDAAWIDAESKLFTQDRFDLK